MSGNDIFGNPIDTDVFGNTSDTNVQGERAKDSFGNVLKDIFGNNTGAENTSEEA